MTTRRAFLRNSLGALGALGLSAQTPFTTEPRKVRVGTGAGTSSLRETKPVIC